MKEKIEALKSEKKESYVLTQRNDVVGFLTFEEFKPNKLSYIIIDYMATLGGDFGFGSKLMEELK
jgi:hypothetical protein